MRWIAFLALIAATFSTPSEAKSQDDAELRRNPIEKRWEYSKKGEVLKRHPFTGEWTYERPEAKLRKNPIEGRWEWS